MGEVFLCPECDDVVDIRPQTKKGFVVLNRETARSKDQWVFAHVRCAKAARRAAKQAATPIDAAEGKRLLHQMLGRTTEATKGAISKKGMSNPKGR